MRALSRGGRHTPPLAAPFLLLDSLTGAPHLSSFTVQSGETVMLASPPPALRAAAARLPHTRTQTEQQTRLKTWSGVRCDRPPLELQPF